jgi:hypothetical protein
MNTTDNYLSLVYCTLNQKTDVSLFINWLCRYIFHGGAKEDFATMGTHIYLGTYACSLFLSKAKIA